MYPINYTTDLHITNTHVIMLMSDATEMVSRLSQMINRFSSRRRTIAGQVGFTPHV